MNGGFFGWVKRLFGGAAPRAVQPPPVDNLLTRRAAPGARKLSFADLTKIAGDAVRHGEGIAPLKRLCVAYLQGAPRAELAQLERDVLPHHDHAAELLRQLQIAFESLAIIEKTKNPDTLISRLFVARQALNQASADAGELFTQEHCAELIAVVDEAASARLADLAIAKVEAFQAKAADAKTDATRSKNLDAAAAHAAESAQHPNIAAADRKRIRDAAGS